MKHLTAHECVICDRLPFLSDLIESTGALQPLIPKITPVAESVVEIIVGQMLSGAAAETIYSRVLRRRNENSLVGSWLLSAEDLIECGLSKAKTRAIIEFGECYSSRPTEIEAWSGLPVEELRREVTSFWGLSDWSADILAISHFGHPDVFPKNDTTLHRAMRMAIDAYGLKPSDWKIEEVRPFRTYLALYLWRSVDMKFWNRFQVEQVLTKHSRPL